MVIAEAESSSTQGLSELVRVFAPAEGTDCSIKVLYEGYSPSLVAAMVEHSRQVLEGLNHLSPMERISGAVVATERMENIAEESATLRQALARAGAIFGHIAAQLGYTNAQLSVTISVDNQANGAILNH